MMKQDRILVAGAASGIGKAITYELHRVGFRVILTDIDEASLQKIQSELHDALIFAADITVMEHITNLAAYIQKSEISLIGLIDTVGKSITLPLKSAKPALYEDIMMVNVFSFHSLARELTKAGLFNKSGASIVVISSVTAQTGAKGKIAYGSSKGAINSMIPSLALELSPQKIRVNSISPGTVRSEMLERLEAKIGEASISIIESEYPLGFGYPQDVAAFAVYLVSPESVWLTGSVITLDGGYSSK